MLRIATLALLLAASSPAAAQERLEMGDAPDVDLFLAAQDFALVLTAGADSRADDLGAVGGLRLGYQSSRNRQLFLRSDLTLYDADELRGDHRLLAQYGFGDADPGEGFADIEIDHQLEHGPGPRAGGRADVGPAAFFDNDIELTSWIGKMQDAKVNGAIGKGAYLSARRRDLHYDAADIPVDGLATWEVTAGFGAHPYHTAILGTPRNMLWLSRSRTDIGDTTVARTDLWLGAKELVWQPGKRKRLRLGLTQAVGWSWIEADGGRAADMFTIENVAHVKSRRASAALGFSRKPSVSPDGSALIADWRATLMVEATSPRNQVGGSIRIVANVLDDLENERDAARRYFFHHELFTDVTPSTRVGAYHLARLAPPGDIDWDLWAENSWSNEVGLFLRSNWSRR